MDYTLSMSSTTVETRLIALEHDVADLRRQLQSSHSGSANWLDRLSGSMEEFPEFDAVVRLGQAARHADRPQDQAGK